MSHDVEEALLQAFARLSVHEFFIEVMAANWVAEMNPARADLFFSEFRDRSRKTWTAGRGQDHDFAMMEEFQKISNNLLSKIEKRSEELRSYRT